MGLQQQLVPKMVLPPRSLGAASLSFFWRVFPMALAKAKARSTLPQVSEMPTPLLLTLVLCRESRRTGVRQFVFVGGYYGQP